MVRGHIQPEVTARGTFSNGSSGDKRFYAFRFGEDLKYKAHSLRRIFLFMSNYEINVLKF